MLDTGYRNFAMVALAASATDVPVLHFEKRGSAYASDQVGTCLGRALGALAEVGDEPEREQCDGYHLDPSAGAKCKYFTQQMGTCTASLHHINCVRGASMGSSRWRHSSPPSGKVAVLCHFCRYSDDRLSTCQATNQRFTAWSGVQRNGNPVALRSTGDTMPNQHPPISELCYLDAANVNSPAGVLSELNVVAANGDQLGSIAGVVIEAAAGRARYFNIRSSGWLSRRHYLVEAAQLGQVDPERKMLRLLNDDVREVQNLGTLREFSDDDLLAAMFPAA